MIALIRTAFCLLLALSLAAPILRANPLRADDDEIYDKVNQRLNADVDTHGRVKIEVKNGVVTLTGMVKNDKARSRAEKLTKKVSGVKDVVNKIEVGEPKPPR